MAIERSESEPSDTEFKKWLREVWEDIPQVELQNYDEVVLKYDGTTGAFLGPRKCSIDSSTMYLMRGDKYRGILLYYHELRKKEIVMEMYSKYKKVKSGL